MKARLLVPLAACLLALPALADGIFDPWHVDGQGIAGDTLRLRLVMARVYVGGAGEARNALQHRADALARESGYGGAQPVDYREGIESGLPLARRYAEGVFRLIP